MSSLSEITQTLTVGDGYGMRGNCLQAAVASWFGFPELAFVPDFANFGPLDDTGYAIWWWDLFVGFWASHGYLLKTVGLHDGGRPIPQERSIVYGDSPRGNGLNHVVVAEAGRIVWDPHPDRTNLAVVRGAWVPERIDELQARARAWDRMGA